MIQDNLEESVEESRICTKLQRNFSLTREAAEEELRSFMEEKAKLKWKVYFHFEKAFLSSGIFSYKMRENVHFLPQMLNLVVHYSL